MIFKGDHVVLNKATIDDPELLEHEGQPAVVTEQKFEPDLEEGFIYRVRFLDGFEFDAFLDELIPVAG
jgi:hypothetical protein